MCASQIFNYLPYDFVLTKTNAIHSSQFTVHSFLEVGHIEFIPKYKKEFQQAMKIGGINLSKTQSVDL